MFGLKHKSKMTLAIFIPLGGSGVTFAICNENDKALTRDMKNRNELHAAPALHNEIGEL